MMNTSVAGKPIPVMTVFPSQEVRDNYKSEKLKPAFAPAAADTLLVNVKQIDALATAVSNIDSYKHFLPASLPGFIAQGRQAIAEIWHMQLYPVRTHELEIAVEQIDALTSCFKCIQDAVIAYQFDLLGPFIETAHDLITLMLGDRVTDVTHRRICDEQNQN